MNKMYDIWDILMLTAKRSRYKVLEIKENYKYFHFVFQGFRFEGYQDKEDIIYCICKTGSPYKSNNHHNYNNNIIYIKNNENKVVYNTFYYEKFKKEIKKYFLGNEYSLLSHLQWKEKI